MNFCLNKKHLFLPHQKIPPQKKNFYMGESRLSHCLLDYHEPEISTEVNGTLPASASAPAIDLR